MIEINKELQDKFDILKKKIEQYSFILIFLQKYTDLDAAGSSIGLLNLIKHNYKNKEIYLVGFDTKPNGINVAKEYLFDKDKHIINDLDTLGISVDASNTRQLKHKEYLNKCTEFVIIDHHDRHELWDQMKQKPILINCNLYGSCSGLLFKIAKHNKWQIAYDVAAWLVKGHSGDVRVATGIPGIWEIFYEISNMGIDVNEQLLQTTRRSLSIIKAANEIFCDAEQARNAVFLTWTRNMAKKYGFLHDSLFTYPLLYAHHNIKGHTFIYFHYLLRENEKNMGIKNIFVAMVKENPALEELLLANDFIVQRNWYYKRGDVMEFKEMFNANRALFVA